VRLQNIEVTFKEKKERRAGTEFCKDLLNEDKKIFYFQMVCMIATI
jgi:hypothetical protein